MHTRKLMAGLATVAMALTILIAPTPSFAQQTAQPANQVQQAFDGPLLYKEAFNRISRFHIELRDPDKRAAWEKEWENKFRGKLTTEEATDKAIDEMLSSLEQIFDGYMTPEAVEAMNQQSDPSFAGVGIAVEIKGRLQEFKRLDALPNDPTPEQIKEANTIRNDSRPFSVADEPMENLPAEKAGLLRGDAILKVDGVSLDGKTSDEAVGMIRGKIDTDVVLTIRRSDETAPNGVKEFDVTIKRAKVVAKVVKSKDLGDGVTHVRLFNFMSKNLEDEMSAALVEAAKGKAIVLDFRGNGGGRLDAANNVLNYLIEEGTVLVRRERSGDGYDVETISLLKDIALIQHQDTLNPQADRISAVGRASLIVPRDMPLVVLIDGGSASASEIVSGALQHQKRAVVMGTPSVGKGVGQAVMGLPFKRGMRVTTFEFLPGGNAMDMVGIIPDVTVEQPDEDRFDRDKDTQLEAAKAKALELVAEADAVEAKAEELRKEKLEQWKKMKEALKGNNP